MKAEQLRKSILQLAIQGKLVKQDPNDEPASVLLERIRAEKQRLIKEGKIKKDKGDSIIFKGDDNCHYEKISSEVKNIEDEIPFEIPDTWCWVRLSHLSFVSAGGTPERSNPTYWQNGNIPWLKISDVTSSNKYVRKCSEYITEEGMNNSSAKILPKGTILYTIFATIGEVGILDFNATCNQAIAGIQTFNTDINDYLYYYLVNLQDFMKSISKGCAQFNINQKILKSAFVPLPPLEEQKRIVDELKKFEPLIAEYDKLEQQVTKLDSEIYDKLKKSILQYAIQGKLVEQDENDEPASALLERIRAEKKAQLGKKYVESYIYKGDDNCYYEHIGGKDINITEEIPFDLPNSWEWARMGNIFTTTSGTTPNRSEADYYATHEYNWVRTTDLNNGELFSAEIQVSTKAFNECRLEIIPIDSICIAMYGGAGTIGKNAMIKFKTTINQSVCAIHPNGYCDMKFLQYYMQFYRPFWMEYASGSRKDPNINQVIIKNTFIPIPPLVEQKRIVDKINEIFAKL